jgi:PAS domain S-box-containing protein
MEEQSVRPGVNINFVAGVLVLSALYLTSLYSYLLFHSLAEVFSIAVACTIFMVAWNSRRFLDNNYLLFLGFGYLFIAGIDLVHTLVYKGMGVFPGTDANPSAQLWISARYVESLSLLIAPLFLRRKLNTRTAFLSYTAVTLLLLGSIFVWDVFPDCYIEGTGLTPFKKVSEYIISLILVASIALLNKNRRQFNRDVFRLLVASILVTIGSELAFTFYVSVYGFFNLLGHFLKIVSFYLIYKAFIETGLMRPYHLLFRDLKQSEEALRRERDFAEGLIETAQAIVLVLDTEGRIVRFNPYLEEMSGYSLREVRGEDWCTIFVHQRDQDRVRKVLAQAMGDVQPGENVNPIVTRDGHEREVEWHNKPLVDAAGNTIGLLSIGQDVTERRQAEEQIKAALQEKEVLLREIHHRVKNNLQVVSSLIGLQCAYVNDQEMQNIYREIQDRVISMALVHEQLHGPTDVERIDLAAYVRNLTAHLLQSYGIAPQAINLSVTAGDVSLSLAAAIPCGLIISELVSNALKYAFPQLPEAPSAAARPSGSEDERGRSQNEIRITLDSDDGGYVLVVSDNGVGFPENLDFRETESLGMRLVTTLAHQLNGTVDLGRNDGTTFTVRFPHTN